MARPAKHTKTAAVKAVKDAAAEAKATAVKAQEKVVAEVKEVAKTAAKTTTRKTCKTSVCVEMNGLSVAVADIQSAVKAAVKAQGLEASELKIYVNANEQAAYYTVDGQGGESYKIDLKALSDRRMNVKDGKRSCITVSSHFLCVQNGCCIFWFLHIK